MKNGKLVAVLVLLLLALESTIVSAGIMDPCKSTATIDNPGACWLICPAGDGPTLASIGATIHITVLDGGGQPIEGIPAFDICLLGCTDLCSCPCPLHPDHATDSNGQTTFSGSAIGGGCDYSGVMISVQGSIIEGAPCVGPLCLPLKVVSPDINCDLVVDLVDFADFATKYVSGYDECSDFDCSGNIDLIDLTIFARHYQHTGC